MSVVMSILAASMRNDVDQMRLVAQNMASADVVAYRQHIGVARPDFASLFGQENAAAGAAPALAATGAVHMDVAIDSRPGTLRQTGEPLDVAIQGDGYFVVSTAQGQLLTRRGDFHLDSSGTLSAFSGDPVLGTQGEIRIKGGTPRIEADGSVLVGGQVIGHLEIAEPAPGGALQPVGDGGLFAASGGQVSVDAGAQVRQGFLETSNVSPVNQMMTLLQTTHHFEADQRFVRAYDQMLDQAINDLGKV